MHSPTAVTARAPGRVNLIGEHTDYQDGWCLPMAIDRAAVVHAAPADTDHIVATSAQLDGTALVELDGRLRAGSPDWGRAVATTVAAMLERDHPVRAATLDISSTVPLGSGLSSSAAMGVAVTLALAEVAGAPIDGFELARTAQRAEHLAGVPCGIMDQAASVWGRAGHAVLLDCREQTVEAVPLPSGIGVVVVHSGLPRRLADSQYAARRAACEAACARLGVRALRDATFDAVADDPFARHVVSENARVHAFVAATRADDIVTMGALLDESHRSLADDYEVSTPELDRLVELLRAEGAYGARLTGAGFGGCVIALTATEDAETIAERAATRYRDETDRNPMAFVARASAGATCSPSP